LGYQSEVIEDLKLTNDPFGLGEHAYIASMYESDIIFNSQELIFNMALKIAEKLYPKQLEIFQSDPGSLSSVVATDLGVSSYRYDLHEFYTSPGLKSGDLAAYAGGYYFHTIGNLINSSYNTSYRYWGAFFYAKQLGDWSDSNVHWARYAIRNLFLMDVSKVFEKK